MNASLVKELRDISGAGMMDCKKAPAKKEAKAEKVDYSKMTVAELKEVATKKEISVTGMKKAEIIAALEK